MATLKEQVAQMQALLTAHGIVMPAARTSTKQTDHIAHGSDAHRQFIGLVEVKEGDNVEGYITFTSPYTDKVYRLDDELGVVNLYPGVDPTKAATLMLRMKINELEGGLPEAPPNAPPMWRPDDAGVGASLSLLRA